jgi:uncharacterized protein (UPF0335 family)
MFEMIERLADCEIRPVIRFLNARNVKTADIHRQICEVYDDAMSDGIVRKWVRKFNEFRDNVHDEPPAGCGHRRPRSTRMGYKNWCHVMTNALTMVEAM